MKQLQYKYKLKKNFVYDKTLLFPSQRHNTKHDQIVAEKWLKYITVDKSKISKDCLMIVL